MFFGLAPVAPRLLRFSLFLPGVDSIIATTRGGNITFSAERCRASPLLDSLPTLQL